MGLVYLFPPFFFPFTFIEEERKKEKERKKRKKRNTTAIPHAKVSKIDLSVLNYSPRLYWPLRSFGKTFSNGECVWLALRVFTE